METEEEVAQYGRENDATMWRSDRWYRLIFQLPVLVLVIVSLGWTPWWSTALMFAGAFVFNFFSVFILLIPDFLRFLLQVGAFVAAWQLGAPLWWVIAFALGVPAWRHLARAVGRGLARYRPPRPDPGIGKTHCRHTRDKQPVITRLAAHGRWADALDVALTALAAHPRDDSDCLKDVALQAGEIALRAGHPDLALSCAQYVYRVSPSATEHEFRACLLGAGAEAAKSTFEGSKNTLRLAAIATGGKSKLVSLIAPPTKVVASVTGSEPLDVDQIIGFTGRHLGTGEAMAVRLLDFADWFRSAGSLDEALVLYRLARHATEFDRLVDDIGKVPDRLGRRWALRGHRFALAVTGQLEARQALGQKIHKRTVAAGQTALTVLLQLGDHTVAMRLAAVLAEVLVAKGRAKDALATLAIADRIENRHAALVADWAAVRLWQDAEEKLRDVHDSIRPDQTGALREDGLPFDSRWLAGTGTAAARTGVSLARDLEDLLGGCYVVALRHMSGHLGGVGLHDAALLAAEEVVRIRRETDPSDLDPFVYLGWPLWRLGRCLVAVGRQDEGLDAVLEALPYFREGATSAASRATCVLAVQEATRMLIDAKRFEEALPLALEQVRRCEELSKVTPNYRNVLDALGYLRDVFFALGRPQDAAARYELVARRWEEDADADGEEWELEAYRRAGRAWSEAGESDRELELLRERDRVLQGYDEAHGGRYWVVWGRMEVNLRIGRIRYRDPAKWNEALTSFRVAHVCLQELGETYTGDWHRRHSMVLGYIGDCLLGGTPEDQATARSTLAAALDSAYAVGKGESGQWAAGIANAATRLAQTLLREGDAPGGLAVIDRALAHVRDVAPGFEWLHFYAHLCCMVTADHERAELEIREADRLIAAHGTWLRYLMYLCLGMDAKATELIANRLAEGAGLDRTDVWLLRQDLDDLARIKGPSAAHDTIRALVDGQTAT
ncbi:hypothetical protein [Promicromonospora sp. NFX87]|uniref:hypothetical protein n=1 Tax=Promicromonospora sp. NFX87 TaxID=3402691 RepID=UPI003AFACA0C